MLSTRRAVLLLPREAYEEHIRLGYASCGTWSFTISDSTRAALNDGGRAIEQLQEDASPKYLPVAHASVDCRTLTRNECTTLGKKIKLAAEATYEP